MRAWPRAIELFVLVAFPSVCSAHEPAENSRQLLVSINGRDTGMMMEFVRVGDKVAARRGELQAVGIGAGEGAADEPVVLDELSGLSFRIDDPSRLILFD